MTRPWLPAFGPEEDSRVPGYTVRVTQGVTKINHKKSKDCLGLRFKFYSVRMSTGT